MLCTVRVIWRMLTADTSGKLGGISAARMLLHSYPIVCCAQIRGLGVARCAPVGDYTLLTAAVFAPINTTRY